MWVQVNAWGKLSKTVGKMVKMGTQMLVSGSSQVKTYTDKSNTERTCVEVKAEQVRLLERKTKLEKANAA